MAEYFAMAFRAAPKASIIGSTTIQGIREGRDEVLWKAIEVINRK